MLFLARKIGPWGDFVNHARFMFLVAGGSFRLKLFLSENNFDSSQAFDFSLVHKHFLSLIVREFFID